MENKLGNEHRPAQPSAKPGLAETLSIFLMASALTIFVFWAASQALGQELFSRLPDWIVGAYKGIWTAAATGTTGVGLAVASHFRHNSPQVDYYKYVGSTTLGFLIVIGVVAGVLHATDHPPYEPSQPPLNATRLDPKASSPKEFELTSPAESQVVQSRLQGTYRFDGSKLIVHLASGRVVVSPFPNDGPVHKFGRISFSVFALRRDGYKDVQDNLPNHPLPSTAHDINIELKRGATLQIPSSDFLIEIPPGTDLSRAWLTAGLWNEIGYMPVQ